MRTKLKNKLRKHWEEVRRLKTSPHSVAFGFALGTFLAILPTFGFGILIGLLFILLFKRVSKISMLVAFAIWNPLVQIPLYTLSYTIGDALLTDLPIRTFKVEIINQFYVYSRRFIVGNLLLATILSIISYVMLLKFLRKSKKNQYTSK